jgi:hypothetical protein
MGIKDVGYLFCLYVIGSTVVVAVAGKNKRRPTERPPDAG